MHIGSVLKIDVADQDVDSIITKVSVHHAGLAMCYIFMFYYVDISSDFRM